MSRSCGCCDQEPPEGASLWGALAAIVFGLLIADRLVGDDVADYLARRKVKDARAD